MSKRLGKMDMVVEKLRTFQESCGLMMQSDYCNPHDPRMGGKCLSVCLSVWVCLSVRLYTARYRLDFFPGGGGGVRTSYCKGNRDTGSNRRMC